MRRLLMLLPLVALPPGTLGCSQYPSDGCPGVPADVATGDGPDVPDQADATQEWKRRSCDEEDILDWWWYENLRHDGVDAGFGFPGTLAVLPGAQQLFYSLVTTPTWLAPPEFEPFTESYLVDLMDYSVVRLGQVPGPWTTCGELATLPFPSASSSLPAVTVCTVFDQGRRIAVLTNFLRFACRRNRVGCFGNSPFVDDCCWPSGCDPPMPARVVGLVQGPSTIDDPVGRPTEGGLLVRWWTAESIAYDEWVPPCPADDAIYPGNNPRCPQYHGPCCRCASDPDCPEGEYCTGRTAAGITYCLRPE